MVKIKATSKFMQFAQKAMSADALQELVDELTCYPEKGVLISG